MIDSRDINELFPAVKRTVIEFIKRLRNEGYPVGISSTYRDFEYQDYLYQQGRTRSGSIITNTKGGESIHNYRLAFDIFQNVKGQEYNKKFLNRAGEIGMKMGLEWGGCANCLLTNNF